MSFTLIPAIDVRDGQVVRLKQGDYQQQTTYPLSPLQQAIQYAEQGAQVLHLVDLDAARLGGFSLHQLVTDIKQHTQLRMQAGGGIRNYEQVASLLNAGADRVVIGTLALNQKTLVQDWLKEFGTGAITLAFDVRMDEQGQWRCASHGWTELSADTLNDVIGYYQKSCGLQHVLCTDIQRDGLLTGYNLSLYQQLQVDWPTLSIQASGGVNSLADISHVKHLGIASAILGRALLDGTFSLPEALQC
jgi:phosphoribosylformimino-5-aminoimidazole carboxamide ribotide isomerase